MGAVTDWGLAMQVLGLALAYLYGFFGLYVLVMGAYRAKLVGHLSWGATPLAYALVLPFVVLGVLVDVLAQYTIATLVCFDLPRRGEHLVTQRLQRYMSGPQGWRRRVSWWLCDHVLDPFDPEGDHC
jgi:hypothetical protein